MNKASRLEKGSRSEKRLLNIAIGAAFFLLILDQLTKLLVERKMIRGESIEIIKGFFSLTYVTNKGAAWGMFHGYGMVLFAVGALVTITAIVFLRKLCDGYPERYLAVLTVLSGVLGNSIDRLFRGEVVDFLDFYIKNRHWPAFNVADCAICAGIFVYTLSVLIRPENKTANSNSPADTGNVA